MIGNDWWRGGVIYEIYPRSFCDTDGDGIGDLKGIAAKLGHIAALGVDAIWIAPFFKSPMRDFGYDVADYRQIDPQFGTLADFDNVVTEAHRLGLKLLVDFVISHTSEEHPWFIESRASRDNPRSDWYVWADMKPEGSAPNNWLSVFGGPSWQWDTRRRQYYLHNFLTAQPDLNMHNPAVQEAMLGEMRFWLERGVDGFRLDALNFAMHDRLLRDNPRAVNPALSEQPLSNPYAYQSHLYDKSQPELPEFLGRIRALLNQYGATTALAEVGDDAIRTLELMGAYAGSGDKIHMCYGFDFLGIEFTPDFFRRTIERYEGHGGGSWPCWAFSNHDCTRHVSRWTKAGQSAEAMARLALALLLSLRGSICLYQGEELGLTEAAIAFEDLQDPAGKTFWPEYKGRDGCRTPMPWDEGKPNAGFSTAKPWLPVPAEHVAMAANRQIADAASILRFYGEALGVRKSTAALRTGTIECVEASETKLVLRRTAGQEQVLCIFNFGNEVTEIGPDVAGETLLASSDSISTLDPLGFRWVRIEA